MNSAHSVNDFVAHASHHEHIDAAGQGIRTTMEKMKSMTFRTYTEQMIPVIQPDERFDAYQVPAIETWLNETVVTQPFIILDMANVVFTDTRALSLLVKYLKRTREQGGDLKLASVSDAVQVILELSKLDQVLRVYPTVEEAAAACTPIPADTRKVEPTPAHTARQETTAQQLPTGVTLLAVRGRFDAFRIPGIQAELDALGFDAACQFVVDLTHVEFLDSAGLALLVKLLRQVRHAGGRLALVRSQHEDANRIFHLTQFDKVFHITPTREAALAHVMEG